MDSRQKIRMYQFVVLYSVCLVRIIHPPTGRAWNEILHVHIYTFAHILLQNSPTRIQCRSRISSPIITQSMNTENTTIPAQPQNAPNSNIGKYGKLLKAWHRRRQTTESLPPRIKVEQKVTTTKRRAHLS